MRLTFGLPPSQHTYLPLVLVGTQNESCLGLLLEDVLRDPKHSALPILHLGCVVGDSLIGLNLEQLSVLLAPIEDLHWTANLKYIHFA
jgi:hypothetical protein